MLYCLRGSVLFGMQNCRSTQLGMQNFHRAQCFQPEGDSRSGFLPTGLPSFPVLHRAPGLAGNSL